MGINSYKKIDKHPTQEQFLDTTTSTRKIHERCILSDDSKDSWLEYLYTYYIYAREGGESEGVGFEPTEGLPPQQFSRLSHLTTLPSFHEIDLIESPFVC